MDNETHRNLSPQLTFKETRCAELVLEGNTAKEIAKILNLSPRTIEHYFEKLKQKFECRSKAMLIKTLTLVSVQANGHI